MKIYGQPITALHTKNEPTCRFDTNCLVQMISIHSPYRPAWQAFREGKYVLCVSDEILNEYQEVIERVANSFVAQNIVEAIVNSPCYRFYAPHFHFGLIRQDYDDNKFVDCAIQAGADFIVSEDSHFNVLKECDFPKVVVIGLDEFVAEFY